MNRELDKVARELGPRRGRVIVGTLERPPEHWMQEYYEYEGEYRRSIGGVSATPRCPYGYPARRNIGYPRPLTQNSEAPLA